MIDIKVPAVGESISEVTLVKWLKQQGQYVERDEVIAELESEKATFEVNAEKAGTLNTVGKEGETLKIGDVLARIDENAARPEGAAAPVATARPICSCRGQTAKAAASSAPPSPAPAICARKPGRRYKATPVAAAIITDKKVDAGSITPSGANGKILKHDVLEALEHPGRTPGAALFTRADRREKMSNLRKTVSRRLVEAKNTTAMLTTFNEVDMSAVMALRTKYKDKFKEKHGVGPWLYELFYKGDLLCFARMARSQCLYRR